MFEIAPAKIAGLLLFGHVFGSRFAAVYTAAFCLIYIAIGYNAR